MKADHSGTLTCRVVTIGDASVGKTSLVSQLIEQTFREEEAPTVGANFREFSYKVQGIRVELQIWDTAGQEKFRSLTPIYFRNAQAAIAVFAMDCPDSLDHLQSQIDVFLSVAGDAVVYVAANKIDRPECVVTRMEAEEFGQSKGYPLHFTSAKTGEGVMQMFESLCAELYRHGCDINRDRTPTRIGASEGSFCC
jgi:small GTP-binding protein